MFNRGIERSRAKIVNTQEDEIGEAVKNNPANSSGKVSGSTPKPGHDTGKLGRV